MNKKAQVLHGHYHGEIPFMIWILIVAIACIAIGWLVPGLGVLAFIGAVLFIIWIGILIIALVIYYNS